MKVIQRYANDMSRIFTIYFSSTVEYYDDEVKACVRLVFLVSLYLEMVLASYEMSRNISAYSSTSKLKSSILTLYMFSDTAGGKKPEK